MSKRMIIGSVPGTAAPSRASAAEAELRFFYGVVCCWSFVFRYVELMAILAARHDEIVCPDVSARAEAPVRGPEVDVGPLARGTCEREFARHHAIHLSSLLGKGYANRGEGLQVGTLLSLFRVVASVVESEKHGARESETSERGASALPAAG